jgi:hypothetical protein
LAGLERGVPRLTADAVTLRVGVTVAPCNRSGPLESAAKRGGVGVADVARLQASKTVTAAGGGCYFGVVAAGRATGIALAFVAAKGYHVALAARTIARYAAGAALGAALPAAATGRRLYWNAC